MENIRYHKNSVGVECYYAIGVIQDSNIKFVTGLEGSVAFWNDGESIRKFEDKQIVDEIVFGLNVNGYAALVFEIPYYMQNITNK